MSDMGDIFNDLKKYKQEKRADNRASSQNILAKSGFLFESKNMGAHLIVKQSNVVIDFWPGTGLWQVRGRGRSKRGVQNLIAFLRSHP